ncbi:hypothetical protein GCM10012275_32490 [Longimycelium tulufanense]|uniref:Uncharacterized protein n=1 Tax=Longimycelium tulufanense TaxID=907463 RepID=A0A8J3CGS9_9PSEU|nr:hypothetical protein [Longimycelium tulufanense]GGM58810.1 hypothetical protein GCM10012275_32490 [Longimycelium tulufanense]
MNRGQEWTGPRRTGPGRARYRQTYLDRKPARVGPAEDRPGEGESAGLRSFDLGTVPASVTPPRSWRRAAWFSVSASCAVLAALTAIGSTVVPTRSHQRLEGMPGYPSAFPFPSHPDFAPVPADRHRRLPPPARTPAPAPGMPLPASSADTETDTSEQGITPEFSGPDTYSPIESAPGLTESGSSRPGSPHHSTLSSPPPSGPTNTTNPSTSSIIPELDRATTNFYGSVAHGVEDVYGLLGDKISGGNPTRRPEPANLATSNRRETDRGSWFVEPDHVAASRERAAVASGWALINGYRSVTLRVHR